MNCRRCTYLGAYDIPSIKEYTEKKPKTKDKAYKLWDQWDVFQRMIDKTALD